MAKPQSQWIVAQTKPLREFTAWYHVRNQGAEPYLPKLFDKRTHRRMPLFPCYLFIKISDGRWRHLWSTIGISRLIMLNENQPATIRHPYIWSLKRMEDEHGLIVLDPVRKVKGFKAGDKVRVRAGAFINQIGLYDGMRQRDRVKVLFEMLGQQTETMIEPHMLELAEQAA